MNKIVLIFLVIYTTTAAQIKATVIDSITREPVPYVNIWVEGEDIGTTSDENGRFELNIDKFKSLHFSAVGYVNKQITYGNLTAIVSIHPSITVLEEVVITKGKRIKERIINPIEEAAPNNYFIKHDTLPTMLGLIVPYEPEYESTPYITKLRFVASSHSKRGMFNVRIYTMSEEGTPKEILNSKNLLIKTKKGRQIVEVDLSGANLKIPEDGIVIAAEWLVTKKNRYKVVKNMYDENGEPLHEKDWKTYYGYGPDIGVFHRPEGESYWFYRQGKWENRTSTWDNVSWIPAVEVTLTD